MNGLISRPFYFFRNTRAALAAYSRNDTIYNTFQLVHSKKPAGFWFGCLIHIGLHVH